LECDARTTGCLGTNQSANRYREAPRPGGVVLGRGWRNEEREEHTRRTCAGTNTTTYKRTENKRYSSFFSLETL